MQAGFTFSKLADKLASLAELSSGDLELLAEITSNLCDFGAHRRDDAMTHCFARLPSAFRMSALPEIHDQPPLSPGLRSLGNDL
ncbi:MULTISPECIES: hypothetical protein [unclassified Bradyrhizobium]|uniref:hypothetical protein n=1 Tax=unclassified Bradyrhizobium TaxID=2631580 RepID=UPI001FF72AAF|nr:MULTISPECIES: hypothetical protein [unclassified Bradyrhizobium]MCK1716075.1 hypothetical protein [Bradyrhizobium sp. 143]MCK1730546.1 hypothetical protein [Bradyrhizobium sp. 142]